MQLSRSPRTGDWVDPNERIAAGTEKGASGLAIEFYAAVRSRQTLA